LIRSPTYKHKSSLDRFAIASLLARTTGNGITCFTTLTPGVHQEDIFRLLKIAEKFVLNHTHVASLQKYIVRYVAAKYQVGAIVEWKKKGAFLDLLPVELKNSSTNDSPDMFLTIDANYKNVRETVRLAWISDSYDDLRTAVLIFKNDEIIWCQFYQTFLSRRWMIRR